MLLSLSALSGAALAEVPHQQTPGAALLRKSQPWRIDTTAPGLRLRVLEGVVWITQTGDRADHLLAAGEVFRTTRPGRIVAESLSPHARLAWSVGRD